jgi:hypothetical protein
MFQRLLEGFVLASVSLPLSVVSLCQSTANTAVILSNSETRKAAVPLKKRLFRLD